MMFRLGQAGAGQLRRAAPPEARHDLGRRGRARLNLVMAIIWALFLTLPAGDRQRRAVLPAMAHAGVVRSTSMFMALNLLPIPPLDGGRILVGLLPDALAYRAIAQIEPFGLFILHRAHGARRARILPGPVPRTRHGNRQPVQLGLPPSMFEPRVLSGMRPTGALHLGHYHGALKNWVQLQDEHPCFFFVADWHALTTHYESPEVMAASVWDMVIDWLAAGRRSAAGDAVHPVARARARGAVPAAVDGHAARLARARADLQGPDREAQGEATSRPTASSAIR